MERKLRPLLGKIFEPVQPIVEPPFVIRVFQCGVVAVFDIQRENIITACCTLYFSLIIVISLQLRGRRQIAKPRKYYLVSVIVFLWYVFSLFFLFLTCWEFSLIPYKEGPQSNMVQTMQMQWYQRAWFQIFLGFNKHFRILI